MPWLLQSKPLDNFLQAISLSNPARRWLKDHVRDLSVEVLEARAPLCLLSKLDEHLLHNIHPKGFSGSASEHGLHGGGHHHPECGQVPIHLGMVDGGNPHPV
jgi:hypothetical protein